jgi:hemerythrin-like metal-binding protein/PAS domain S-box-containing protein
MINSIFQLRSLKSRITLLTLAIVVVSIWSLALYAGRMLREDLQQQLGAQQFATVSLVAAGINEELSSRLAALERIATEFDAQLMGNPVALQARLEQRPLLQNLFNAGVFVTGADGTAIADVPASAGRIGTNYIDRDSVSIPLKEGKAVIGRPAMGKKLGAPIFSIVVPIRTSQGRVIGTLVGTVNLGTPNFLDKITTGRYGDTGGYLLIAPQHNLFVTATDKSRIMQPVPAPGINPMHDRYMKGYEGYGIATSSRGVEEVSAAKGVPVAGWFIAAVLPADEAFAPIHALQRHMLTAMIFLTLLAGGLIWWTTSRILRRQLSPMLVAAQVLNTRADTGQSPQPLPVTSQDEIGELIGGFNRLLTTQGQREDALRESEALFCAVSESAHDAIITADGSGKIIKWNPSAGHTFGYSESEAIGQLLTFLMPARFRDRHEAGMSRVSAGGEPHVMGNPVELVGLRKDGSEFPLELSLARWQIAEGYFVTGVIRDITARKNIERKLEDQREHLEELVDLRTSELTQALEAAKVADQTKDAFLANMSHELRTPLSAVIGMANLARGISTEPRLRDYLNKIAKSGQHLNSIINELLDLSKITAGRMELEIIPFSLRKVNAHAESVMSHRAAEKGLKLATLIDDAVPDLVLGDPTRVTQIFLNLIGNAIKFTEAGQVTVRIGLQASEENRVCLAIDFEDTGIGMRPEHLEQLFKPFSQADATVSRKFGGTGLGLTISRRLAEMMDGDISVTSIEGSGTTFKLRLWLGLGNAVDLQSAEPEADEVLPKRYQDARILVADDQPLNREIVEALLAEVGIVPRMTENGQQALDILTESGPDAFDLVLMDIQMPVMDGLTATRALRSLAGFEKLPIIAMTAHTMTHEQKVNAAAGMNDHIGKPFDNAGFYRTLAKWIPLAKQKTTGATDALPAKLEALHEAGNELSSLRGVDVAAALARFCGNEVSYRRWLTEFVATAGVVPGQMRSEIAAGHGETAAKTVHAFKGRVGMLGMTGLHGMASELELVLHDGTPADELLARLERSVREMCSELTRVLTPRPADTATTKPVLEKVVWNDSYSVGVPALDDQHKKLVGLINRLADCHAASNCGSSGAFHEVLSRMFDYAQVHFKAEEDHLHRIGYPQLAEQKIEHAAFVGKMASFSMAAAEGAQDAAAVHRYLKAWLLSHILESDMQYRPFVESKL